MQVFFSVTVTTPSIHPSSAATLLTRVVCRMSIFSELSWAQILGENGTDSNSQSRTSMDTITEMGH